MTISGRKYGKEIGSLALSWLLVCLLPGSCVSRRQSVKEAAPLQFPTVKVPSVYSDPSEAAEYLSEHYWDAFFALDGRTDSLKIQGVPESEVEQAFANYLGLLSQLPLPQAQKGMKILFGKMEARHLADTASRCYIAFSNIVSRYLYDPNSPLRDEDLYLPFVQGLAESPCTRENYRVAYRHEAGMCSMNPRGSVAPDFVITRRDGSRFRLHQIKAGYTLLFFSNPGCHACKEIIDQVMAIPDIESRMARKEIAVLNVYIDEDLAAWREYEHNYPRSWYSGYDASGIIRADLLYNVRAIPSLYLLDADKRILMKDAPTDRVVALLSEPRR